MARNYGQVGSGGAVGTTAALLPVLQGARVEGKATRKLGAAEAGSCPNGAHVYIKRERELMYGGGFRLALGNFGSLAHGIDEFVGDILPLHGLILQPRVLSSTTFNIGTPYQLLASALTGINAPSGFVGTSLSLKFVGTVETNSGKLL
jgi:hypothetical protein